MSLIPRALNMVERHVAEVVGRVLWPPTSVAALVETDENEVLALNVLGRYELPGDIVKAGEGVREAAKREILEETGFTVEIGEVLDIRPGGNSGGGIHYFFAGEITGGKPSGFWEGTPAFIPKATLADRVWRIHHAHVHEYLFPEDTG
jgi:8-oxo-dGTP pyrophosphatase MutT (NUDIX family)